MQPRSKVSQTGAERANEGAGAAARRFPAVAVTCLLLAGLFAGCAAGDQQGGVLQQAGSSTVFPIAEAWAAELAARGVQVSVAGGGSGAGASKLCAGEIHIGDMSRPMKESERETCQANGIEPVEWVVAYDGLTVVIHPDNHWVDHLTVEELNHIWRADGPAQTWADVREGWPDEEIVLFGPDSDSGTYDYFNEVILDEQAPRDDYTPSANDNVLVEGVAQESYAVGHFGFAYFDENRDRISAVPIQDGPDAEPVTPSFQTIGDGSYTPLSRPIFMYSAGAPEEGTNLHRYFEYAMTDGQELIQTVGYVALEPATLQEQRARLGL